MRTLKISVSVKPIAIAVCSAIAVYGCLGGDGGSVGASSVAIPVEASNSPLIGVMMRVDCANGSSGTGTVGSTTSPGLGSITVSGTCTAPIKITAIGAGKMRPIGAKSDGSEDVSYDPAVNLPISSIMTTLPTSAAPAQVNPVTMLVAEKVAPTTAALATLAPSTVTAAQTTITAALGITVSDITQDYRNANIAAASTRIAEVAALAAAKVATNGVPAAVTGQTSLGTVIAQGLANQVAASLPNGMSTAAQIATAVKAIDSKLDATGSAASLAAADSDSVRVNNLVIAAQNATQATSLADVSSKAAQTVADAIAAGASGTPTQQQMAADGAARKMQAAIESIQVATAKMVTDVATTSGISVTALQVAEQAATRIIADQITALAQAGAKPADLAAQAKAVADSVSSAIKSDASATTKILATPPAVGIANAAAILVGQALNAASAVTATSSTGFNTDTVAANALKVARALKDVDSSSATTLSQQAAFQAAIQAVAAKIDPSTVTTSSAAPASLTTLLNSMTTSLAPIIGGSGTVDDTTEALAGQVAQLAMQTTMGMATSFNLATPPATTSMIFSNTLPTTTTTSSTSSTSKATTTTTTTTTTAPTTTSTAAPTTTTTAAATTTTTAPTTTTTATTTTTTLAFTGICQVSYSSATAFVTSVPSAASCSSSVLGFDGTPATVTVASTVLSGKTSVVWTALATCNQFGAPPAAGATTATPCKN